MEALHYLQPTGYANAGDLQDVAALGRHPARLREEQLRRFEDIEQTDVGTARRHFRDMPSSVRPDQIIYMLGNHEHRWYSAQIDPRVAALVGKLQPHIAFADLAKVIPYQTDCGGNPHNMYELQPNLFITHGWSHAARAADAHLASCTDFSLIYGHTHRAERSKTRPNPRGGRGFRAWSPGCLASKTPSYRGTKPPHIDQGFTIIHVSKSDPCDWTHYDVEINDGRCILPDGKEIRA
jgi:hypothetical protein